MSTEPRRWTRRPQTTFASDALAVILFVGALAVGIMIVCALLRVVWG